jgi:hypothetical protein
MPKSMLWLTRIPAAALIAIAAAMLAFIAYPYIAHAQSTNNPLAYAKFAFIAGDWSHENLDTATVETLSVGPVLESGMLKVVFKSVDEASRDPYTELWLVGWDPGRESLYMDVYSTGGYRSVMDGKMVVPDKVWVFETPSTLEARFRERRTVTKISNNEMAIKYEFAFGPGPIGNPFERKYVRTAPYSVSSEDLEAAILVDIENATDLSTEESSPGESAESTVETEPQG